MATFGMNHFNLESWSETVIKFVVVVSELLLMEQDNLLILVITQSN